MTQQPIAESFGDLDPLVDLRVDDVTPDTPFVGSHALSPSPTAPTISAG
ncbi:hypothetical protein [Frankia sp. AgB32]|nr:hypothetical protein [Frankia sp. AgB32]MCK9897805.1 hypothetical protein [Frankia sp. AgB32]